MKLPYRKLRKRGFLLPMALTLLTVLLILLAGLFTLAQRANQTELDEESRLALLLGSQEVHAQMLHALETGQGSAGVSPGADFSYPVPRSRLTLSTKWGGGSVNNPVAGGWGSFENLLGAPTSPVPEMAFSGNQARKAGSTVVSPGHTLMDLLSSAGNDRGGTLSSYSQLFPYGLYAPNGSVVADSVFAFSNPAYSAEATDGKALSLSSGRPVDVCAGAALTVSESYPSGRALSVAGPVKIPIEGDGAGAIPMSGYPHHLSRMQPLADRLRELGDQVAADSVDKTEFFDDELFTAEHLRQLFSGKTDNLISFFGVGQACKIPFFPIPGMQDDAPFLIVFYVMCPYPIDFSAAGPSSSEGTKKLKELSKELKEKNEALQAEQQELQEARSEPKPDKARIARLEGEIQDLEGDIASLKEQIKETTDQLDDDAGDLESKLSDSKVPQTAKEDGEQRVNGWSYLYIMGKLLDIVKDLVTGKDPFAELITSTRVVHLGDGNPSWTWGDGLIDMKTTLSVAPGRTLHLEKRDIKVRGDVYLMKGSVLKVSGNLTVRRPDGWTDFSGETISSSDLFGYPKGRLIMEPGSSLVVDGDLTVEGGDYNEGSVMLVGDYGLNHGITGLITATGDISMAHGIAPGVTMGDLIDQLADGNSALQGFNDDFFAPLISEVAPQVAKLPYVGPWQWRNSYFAKYATTFEFIPLLEVIGLGGPWPIPLPFDNCLRPVFDYLSIVYSTELNYFTGDNLFTMSPFWFFGRGVTPVLFKVRPELVADAVGELNWEKISWDAFRSRAEKFVVEVLPEFAVGVFKDVIIVVVERAVKSVIPFENPSCGDQKSTEAETIKQEAEKFLKEALGEFEGLCVASFKGVLRKMKNEVYDQLDSNESGQFSPLRELPGVAVLAGNELTVGNAEGARMALGLLVAEGNVKVDCQKTIGVVASLQGDVEVQDLYHYPYFDRASLYSPKKFAAGLGGVFESQTDLLLPQGSLAGDASFAYPRRLAEGWR